MDGFPYNEDKKNYDNHTVPQIDDSYTDRLHYMGIFRHHFVKICPWLSALSHTYSLHIYKQQILNYQSTSALILFSIHITWNQYSTVNVKQQTVILTHINDSDTFDDSDTDPVMLYGSSLDAQGRLGY